jgi:hypothetical protein
MFSKPTRMTLVALGLLVTLAAGYRAFEDETSLNRGRQEAGLADAAVGKALELLLDIRASLHAYVAPGQGLPFWAKRTQDNIDSLRQTLITLDGMTSAIGQPLSESLDSTDQLTAAERRARTYVSRGEMLLAGDVVFTEVRDLLASATNQVDSVRGELARRHEQRAESLRAEQIMLAGGVLAMWIALALFLAPTEARPVMKNPAEWRNELKETLSKPVATPAALAPPAPVAPALPQILEARAPSVAVAALRETSEICADLSSLSDPGALQGTLSRVSAVLDATGLIVWIASNDGKFLSPVATHGFDAALVARIGKVPRDGANLTAAAFRDNTPKISPPTATTPAALAVAMCSPSGPAGVLSVELKPGQLVDEAKVALASIIAAQLATLTMPIALEQLPADVPSRPSSDLSPEVPGTTHAAPRAPEDLSPMARSANGDLSPTARGANGDLSPVARSAKGEAHTADADLSPVAQPQPKRAAL